MSISELRKRAQYYFNLQQEIRVARHESWDRWKGKRGGDVTEEILFEEVPQVKSSFINERDYVQLALLYAAMAIMEMIWEEMEREE